MKLKEMLVGLEGLKVKGDLELDIKGIEEVLIQMDINI